MPKGRPWDYAKSDPRYKPKKKMDKKERRAAFLEMVKKRGK